MSFTQRVAAMESGGEAWGVRIENSPSQKAIDGVVKIIGVPVGRADALRDFDWNYSGTTLSGAAKGPSGQVLAWFKGEIREGKLKGTFTAVSGQDGVWEWEGPLPDMPGQKQ